MSSGLGTGWQEDLIDFIISGGTVGHSMSDILRRFQNRATADMITSELESYQVEERVQKFTFPPKSGKGRPTTMWRATTKMVESTTTTTTKMVETNETVDEGEHRIVPSRSYKKGIRRSVANRSNGKPNTKR